MYKPGVILRREEVFPHLYRYADCCLSTSVAEGFGYALYEPWAHGRPLVGRRPLGFEPIRGAAMEYLYDRFPIPVQWVRLKRLASVYERSIRQCFGPGMLRRSHAEFLERFTRRQAFDGSIDFGLLDTDSQLAVLQRLLQCPGERSQLATVRAGLDAQERQARDRLAANRAVISSALGGAAFDRQFRRCLLRAAPHGEMPVRPQCFERFFASLDQHRLLLAPGS
jgi:hypothetical protein